ncbi:MAG: hypothetical protein ACC657_18030, partial [Thiohalomonadales bacterium]
KICYIKLMNEAGIEEYSKRNVKGKFETTFLISPYGGNYTIKTVCNNKVTNTYKINKNTEASYENPFKLGNISQRE